MTSEEYAVVALIKKLHITQDLLSQANQCEKLTVKQNHKLTNAWSLIDQVVHQLDKKIKIEQAEEKGK